MVGLWRWGSHINMDEWFMVNDGDVFSDYSTQTNGLMAYGHGKKGFLIYHGYSSIPMDVFTMAHSEHRNWRYLPGLLRQ